MRKKLLLVVVLFFVAVISHYVNNHLIFKMSRRIDNVQTKIDSLSEINLNLLSKNSQLSSRERIQELAITQLGMFYPQSNSNIYDINWDKEKGQFCLSDYIIPSVQALDN